VEYDEAGASGPVPPVAAHAGPARDPTEQAAVDLAAVRVRDDQAQPPARRELAPVARVGSAARRQGGRPGRAIERRRCPSIGAALVEKPRATARDVEGGSYLQTLLVSAVASILVTRLYLGATGYPRVGGSQLHIAHMLWGGLLMLVAQVVSLALLGRRAKRIAAVVGGVGFGLFIDELGKFVTADNDYFFQPTIALIYLVFVALFLGFRAIERRSFSPHELLANAADTVRELVLGGATHAEVARGLALLERCGVRGPLADAIRGSITAATTIPTRRSALARLGHRMWHLYDQLLGWRWFQQATLVVFIGQALLGVVAMGAVGSGAVVRGLGRLAAVGILPTGAERGIAGLSSATVSLVLVGVGVAALARHRRLAAYRWFERSVLVAIFVTQVILFWQDQLAALGGLLWNLLLLGALRYLIRQETARLGLATLTTPADLADARAAR